MKLPKIHFALLACSIVVGACGEDTTEPPDDASPLSGGATTVFSINSNAFSTPAPNLAGERFDLHMAGDAAFEAQFVSAPAITNTGLGPVFNNNACVACHPRDGRGRPPHPGETPQSLFLRISLPGSDPVTGAPAPVPGYGTQLFDKALFGVPIQGRFTTNWTEIEGKFADGESYWLRKPEYQITDAYRSMPSNVLISPRVAPAVFGDGLLEAIPESTILSYADPSDADGDGISGKANYVWNFSASRTELGRFGWKASNSTLVQQSAGAYNGDMGITTSYFPNESSHGTEQHDGRADDPEVPDEVLESVIFYVRTLGVPARRDIGNADVMRGETIFREANCTGCHIPTAQTGSHPDVPEVSGQTIHAYTDLLLHDMGEGLADGRPDYLAGGQEWRTPPLWGIGLTYIVNGHTFFLHDGRARNLIEAIMWHGGEAEDSREYVRNLSREDRRALIRFVESL